MQVELDLVKELSVVYDSVKQGYMNANSASVGLRLKDALARLDILINLLKGGQYDESRNNQ